MSTILRPPADERTNQLTAARRAGGSTGTPRREEENVLGARSFLGQASANGSPQELGRELPSEGEARVEALKLGCDVLQRSEWRPDTDFGGKIRELKRESITRKERS